MLKNVSKRLVTMLLVFAMVLSLMPLGSISSFADSGSLTMNSEGLTASYSGDGTWSGGGTSAKGSVTGTKECNSNKSKNATLTFTNGRDKDAKFSFDYNITVNTGSVTIYGETVTGSGSKEFTLEAGDSVQIVITSGFGEGKTTSIELSNISLVVEANATTTFKASENGSYTVNGEVITEDTQKTNVSTEAYTLVATPAAGYKFLGWYNTATNGYYSTTASITFATEVDTTIYPVFLSETTPAFQVGKVFYTDFNEAIAAASADSSKQVTLANSGTLPAGEYTIPADVKLLIPFDESYTADFDEEPRLVNNADGGVYKKPTAYKVLTIGDGAVVNCYGQINVNSQMYVCTNIRTSTTTGPYGAIDLTAEGKLNLENGSKLYAYGYIGGEGTVEGKAGSHIYQFMQICDWRGGTATSNLKDKLKNNSFIFSQYYFQNIESGLKVNSGSTMYAITGLVATASILGSFTQQITAPIIGTGEGLFRMDVSRSEDYIFMKYDGTTDRVNLELHGNVSTVSISLKISLTTISGSFDTKDYILPLPMNYTIVLKEGSNLSFTEKLKVMPGTEIIVEKGANVTIGSSGAIYLYDVDDWLSGKYSHKETHYQLLYVHSRKSAPVTRKLTQDGMLQVDGMLQASGPIYSTNYTENGGDATITGSGTVSLGVFGSVDLLEVPGNETDSLVTIPCVPVLGNLAGHEGNVSFDLGTYNSVNGQWYQYTMTVDSVTVQSGALQDGDKIYLANAKGAPANVIVTAEQPCVTATNATVTKNTDGTYTISNITGNSKVVSGEHTPVDVPAVAPDCVTPGSTAGQKCSACGEFTTPTSVIPALGHTEVVDPAVPPTCTETGLSEGSHCSVCNTVTVAQTVVPALGHTSVTDPAVPPTCTDTGLSAGSHCDVCGETLEEQTVVNALGHEYSIPVEGTAVAPGCETDGKTSDMKCSRCDSVASGGVISATNHNYSIVLEETAVAPTCTTEGKDADVKCANCDAIKAGAAIAATGHDIVIDKAVAPTCTEIGLTEGSHCDVCGETIVAQEVVDALDHDYVDVVTPPTCTHDGYTTHTCSRCDDTYVDSYVENSGNEHSYDSFKTVSPSCTTDGYQYAICSLCGHESILEQTIKPAYGHTFSYGVQTSTCTEGGYTVRTCDECNYTDTVNYTDPLGHDCVATRVYPTCTEQGYSIHNCSRCEYTHIPADSYKPAYGHQYEVLLNPATCIDQGFTVYECFDCGHRYIDAYVDPIGHSYEEVVTAPTCDADGYTTYTCYCGHSYQDNFVSALGCAFGEWVITKAPTCTEDGERQKTCERCGDVVTEAVTATGHSHIPEVTLPTCTEKGFTTYTCHCGDTYVDNYINAKGHTAVVDAAVAPSCSQTGLTEGSHCEECGEILVKQEVVEKLAHTFGEWSISKVPSCKEEGEQIRFCEVCGGSETRPLAKVDHIPEVDAAVAPRYDATGLTEGSHCSVCGETLVAQETVEKLEVNWQVMKEAFKHLETYAVEYAKNNPGKDAIKLMINFIRTGVDRYNDDEWTTMAGPAEEIFINEVYAKDLINGTYAYALREIDGKKIVMPNGEKMEFDHLFGALNVASKNNYSQTNADFGSWVGDLCDLMLFVWEGETITGGYNDADYSDIESLIDIINEKYFGVVASSAYASSFSLYDVKADLDAIYMVSKISSGATSLSSLFEEYYSETLSDRQRAAYFLNNRFAGSLTQEEVRASIFDTYKNHFLAQLLESGRELSSYNNLRQACCYSFADYLYDLAKDDLVAPETPEEKPEGPSYPDIYEVFNSTSQTLAPGVTQTSNYAINSRGEQIVYHVATADLSRDDVHIYANYANNDPSKGWAMSPVSQQMTAAIQNHQDVANYNPVVGINGGGYNMSTGEPSGYFVMEGVTYKDKRGSFFGILKDGTPIYGTAEDYDLYKDQIQEAVASFGDLVRDGKCLISENDYSYAPRSVVGITADNKVIFMALDGRQAPYSAGASTYEIAHIMMDLGCVQVMNLDGGGSTTFVAKPEGSDDLKVLNRPSDSVERAVSNSLMIVSTAPTSKEFDHAIVNTPTDYLTVGSTFDVSLIGVGAAGNMAEIPEGAYLQVSDSTIGKIEGTTFTALARGTVEIQLVYNDTIVGTKTVEIIRRPTALKFEESNINVIYGVAETLPLVATYNNSPVTINANDIHFELSNGSAGTMEGFAFVGNEASGVRNVTVTAKVRTDVNITASIGLRLYSADESIFDFDNATAGNESLAWNRDVTNTFTRDEKVYFTVDTDSDIEANYTFAIDMKAVTAPARLQPLMEYLEGFAGNVGGNASPWDFLLALGGRVSELTTITIEATFPENIDIDISDISFVNDFLKISSYNFNEETRTLTIECGWTRQTEGIDPSTANSIAILSGVKLIPTDAAKVDGSTFIDVEGKVTYDIYLDTSQLHSFAKDPANQEAYGIYDYINPNNPDDAGGHFKDTYITFEDHFEIRDQKLNGWVTGGKDNDMHYYYKDNEMLTGLQLVPDLAGSSTEYYYMFGEDGAVIGKYTGIYYDETLKGYRYFVLGQIETGWIAIDSDYYYFDPATTLALTDGVHRINSFKYTFDENGVLIKGHLVRVIHNGEYHMKYMFAGKYQGNKFVEIDGNTYWFGSGGIMATGTQVIKVGHGHKPTLYEIGDDGIVKGIINQTGAYNCNGTIYGVINGVIVEPGLFICEQGIYYCDNTKGILKTGKVYIDAKNATDLITKGYHYFDETGKMYHEEFVVMDGIKYYMVYGLPTTGAFKVGDDVYYANWKGEIQTGKCTISEANTNGVIPAGEYFFSAEGKFCDNGFVEVDGKIYYILDGRVGRTGAFEADGNLYYANWQGIVQTGKYYITADKTNGIVTAGWYYADETGRMYNNEFVDVDGNRVYVVNGQIKKQSGVVEIDGDLYIFNWNGIVLPGKNYVTATSGNGIVGEGWYYSDSTGRLYNEEFVEIDGNVSYMINGQPKKQKGVTEIDGSLYCFEWNGTLKSGKIYIVEDSTNGLVPASGWYYTDETGRFYDKEFINIDGNTYYMLKGQPMKQKGVTEIDGSLYCFEWNGILRRGKIYIVEDSTNGLVSASGWYYTDETGRFYNEEFIDIDGNTYYMLDGQPMRQKGVTEIDGSLYCFEWNGILRRGKIYIVEDSTNGLLPSSGWYYTDETGRFYNEEFIDIDGSTYYMIDGQPMKHKGVMEIDGSLYYFEWNGTLKKGKIYVVEDSTNGLVEKIGWYYTDETGRFYNEEFAEIDSELYFLIDGQIVTSGVFEVDGILYYATRTGKIARNGNYYIMPDATNDLIIWGYHDFDADGKMIS